MLLRRYHKQEVEEPEEVEEIDYTKLVVKELKTLADNRGIEYDSNIKRADLIKLLK